MRGLMTERTNVRYTRHQRNIGALANFDAAFRAIKTPYFLPLADDDFLLPNFVHEAHAILRQNSDLGAVVFQTQHMSASGEVLAVNPANERLAGRIESRAHLAEWMRYGHYQWSSILWNQQVLQEIGPPELTIGLANDVDFEAQAFCRFPVWRVLRPGAVYCLHPEQGSIGTLSADWASIVKRLDQAVRRLRVIPPDDYRALRRVMINNWRVLWRPFLNREGALGTWRAAWQLGFRFGSPRYACQLLLRNFDWQKPIEQLRSKLALRTRLRRLFARAPARLS